MWPAPWTFRVHISMPRAVFAVTFLAVLVPGIEFLAHSRAWAPSHDDTLSLLLSSGSEERMRELLAGNSTKRLRTAEVVRLMAPPRDLNVISVVRDVYSSDIHPPLYFVLLHVWRRLAGGGTGTAIALSITLCSLSACGLALLVARAAGPVASFVIGAMYCLSPAYREAALTARQYALGACLAVPLAGVVLSRIGRDRRRGRAAAISFVLLSSLLALSAYQSLPLIASLLVGWLLIALHPDAREERGPGVAAVLGVATLCAPIVLLAAWQGHQRGALGRQGWLVQPTAELAGSVRDGLQAFVSLFIDVPFTWVPLPLLVMGTILFLMILLWVLARSGARARGCRLFFASLLTGAFFYGTFVVMRVFPARFHVYYFVAFSAVNLCLLAGALPNDFSYRRRPLLVLAILCLLSASTFAARALRCAFIDQAHETPVFRVLQRSSLLLTDARLRGHVLRYAARLPRDSTIWLIRLPVDDDDCNAIGATARTLGATLARTGQEDPLILEAAMQRCIGASVPVYRARLAWLDLVRWGPSSPATP